VIMGLAMPFERSRNEDVFPAKKRRKEGREREGGETETGYDEPGARCTLERRGCLGDG